MLKHIVMWTFKEEALGKSKIENILKAKKMIENLEHKVDGILELELGVNKDGLTGSYDLVLCSAFKDKTGLESYQNHPSHIEVIKFMKEAVEVRACVDYEI